MPLKPSKYIKVEGTMVAIKCKGLKELSEALTELRIKKREYRILERDALSRGFEARNAAQSRSARIAAENAERSELAGIRHYLHQFTQLIPRVQALLLREPPETS